MCTLRLRFLNWKMEIITVIPHFFRFELNDVSQVSLVLKIFNKC